MTTAAPLQILGVGTGRDGTISLTAMVQALFDHEGKNRSARHEYAARPFYNAYSEYKETGDGAHLLEIRRLIAECPHDAIIGNGYAMLLPLFAEAYPNLTLIHVRRLDRGACIASLRKNSEISPVAYRYYSDDPAAAMKRLAAFHLGEMSRTQWDSLNVDAKFGWYYDRTHSLISQSASLFKSHIEINTETLNDESTRRRLAEFVSGAASWVPGPTHLNAHNVDLRRVPASHRDKVAWQMRRLDLHALAQDDVYALDYFAEKFVAWIGGQVRHAAFIDPSDWRTDVELVASIERAEDILHARLRDLDGLKRMTKARSSSGKS
jgi:hypothetical protein